MRAKAVEWGCLVLAAACLGAPAAGGRIIYRWSDQRGVIHFADVPPPHVTEYTAQQVSTRPLQAATAPAAAAEPAGAAATPQPGKAPSGPARVVIKDRNNESAGGSVQTFSGKVENKGGAEATDVAVTITVVEPGQGEECLEETVEVDPSTLGPGDSGSFEVEYDHPCFLGPVDIDMAPEWQ